MDRIKIEKTDELLCRLHLLDRYEDKLTSAEFLQIRRTKEHDKDISESDLSSVYLHKLLMLDYRARYIQVKQESSQEIIEQNETHDFFDTTEDEDTRLEKTHIHPLEVQMAVFHCADSFLKQKMVTKLSQCQYALPLLIPEPFTEELQCPLWTFREIKKTWKKKETKDGSNVVLMKSMSICKAVTPMVFCLRLGDLSVSKSQLINTLINDRHSTFFHRNCPGNTKTQLLFEGMAEIAWYCPAGKPNDNFTDCVAFCNLHGDGLTHNKQMNILLEMSSINIVFVAKMDRNHESAAVINHLLVSPKPLIVLIENNGHSVIQFKKGNYKYKIGLKHRTLSDVSEDLKKIIRDVLSSPHKPFQLESMSDTGFRVDENDASCTQGLFFAKDIMKIIQSVNMSDIKETFLPCQGQLWHDWCRTNKELYRLQRNIEVEKSLRLSELQGLREKQCEVSCSELIQSFVKHLSSSVSEKEYFLKWTQILLDSDATECLTLILEKYHQKWSELLEIKKNPRKPDELRIKQAEVSKLSTDLQSATCGLEHIFREMAQIYEAHKCLDKAQTEVQTDWSKYPQLAAELLISGHPMELMDGDAGHVPLTWISSVMDQLIHRLGDKSVFVLSVLGIQSSGKSTLLNAMFGLQFAVSAGRCTRGTFMQLVKLSEELKTEFLWDYILVVDTEGLRALELEGNNTIHHDNELATFVVGLGNMTLVNIFGENPSEIQDVLQIVVQAFMRMKKVKLSSSCVFVHQNVSDVSAEEKNMYAKRKLQEKLDKMVELAAKEEECEAENFSDIIKFDVHKDVKYFAPLWEGTPPMAPTNPGYSESVQDLRNYILTKAKPSPGIKLSMFKTKVDDLWNALLNENFVFSFKNTLEIAVYRRLEVEYGNWTWALRQEILNIEEELHTIISNETRDKVDQNFLYRKLTKTYNETKQSISEFFEKDKDKEILIQWRGQHELKIQTFQDELVQGLERKLSSVFEQKKASKELEERKTMFENKLLQKSKELAHQLRGKSPDEQELKQQFGQVWESLVSEVTQGMNPPETINFEDDVIKVIHELGFEKEQITSRKALQEYKTLAERGDFTDCVTLKRKESLSSPEDSAKTQAFLSGHLPAEDQKVIDNLITKVDQETSELLKMEPVVERGYSPNYLRKMGQYMLTSIDTFESEQKFNLRKHFKVDLMLYVMDKKEKSILDSHSKYMNNNDACTFLDGKKEEYYSLFKGFYRESSSAVVLATLICEKIKASMRDSVINQTSIDIAGELKHNVPAFKQSRLILEKHLLKSLATKKDFKEYIHYIEEPRSYTEFFIREEVDKSLQETMYKQKFRLHFMKNILNIKHHLDPALYDATEKTKAQNGDISMWLQDFTQSIKVKLTFGSISSQNFIDVNNFDFLKEEVGKGLKAIVDDLKRVHVSALKTSRRTPDQILIDQLCDCCWEMCPFCGAVCTNSVKNHKLAKDGGMDHSVPFHRSPSVKGFHYKDTIEMSLPFCSTQVAGNATFHPDGSNRQVPYKRYREAGPPADTWSITPHHFQLSYWQWMVCTFKEDLEKNYNMKYYNHGEIPNEWKRVTLKKAIANLEEMYKTV